MLGAEEDKLLRLGSTLIPSSVSVWLQPNYVFYTPSGAPRRV